MNAMEYILTSTVCLSLCFLIYKLIYRNENYFKQLRFFLLASILISLLLPINNVQIRADLSFNRNTQKIFHTPASAGYLESMQKNNPGTHIDQTGIIRNQEKGSALTLKSILILIYFVFALFLIGKLILQLLILTIHYFTSEKTRGDKCFIINNVRYRNTFSFFNWIFIHSDPSSTDDVEEILAHEKIHVSQLHSIDLILIDILSAVMWFNPVVWMIRKEIQLVHEYLADEGALSTGIDKLRYQALMINQVTEEKLIRLSSSFNHSLIKKRMIMMANNKFNQRTRLKALAIIPLAVVLFLGVACKNGQNKSDVITAMEPIKMNILYIGVDNPLKIATSGYEASDLAASIDNGTITGQNGEFIAHPKQPGTAIITVTSKGKEIQKTTFRVRAVPDPVAKVAGKRGGPIDKKILLEQNVIVADIENFDFDISFEIVEFTVFTVVKGYAKEYKSNSNKITPEQKELFKQMKEGTPLYFQDIKCKGPDGSIRSLATMNFRVD